MTNVEGASSVSSITGELLFYTDGQSIWNKNQKRIDGGFGLSGGESSTTSALAIQRPGSNEYYIFTSGDDSSDTIRMSYTRINCRDKYNEYYVSELNASLLEQSTEKIAATDHSNGEDIWIIGIDAFEKRICSWLLTDSGLSTNPIKSALLLEQFNREEDIAGYMKVSPNGKTLAICELGSEAVCICGFNNTTGIATYLYTIHMQEGLMPYGLEYCLDSRFMYVTCTSRKPSMHASLIQYDLSINDPAAIESSHNVITIPQRKQNYEKYDYYGSLQLALDKRIYHVLARDSAIGIINYPSEEGDSCRYELMILPLVGAIPSMSFNSYSLPVFNQSIFNPYRFAHSSVCVDDPMTFIISDLLTTDSIKWVFNDSIARNKTDTGRVVEHIFTVPGRYWVSALSYSGNSIDTITQRVTIYQKPDVSAMPDTTICHASSVRLDCRVSGAREPLQYHWYPEARLTTPYSASTIATPDSSSTYYVSVTDLTGCQSIDSICIEVLQELQMVGPKNVEICSGQSADLRFEVSGGALPFTYTWYSASLSDTSTTSSLLISPKSDEMYYCILTDGTGCQLRDSIWVDVLDHAEIQVPKKYMICKGVSTTIDVSMSNAIGDETISWEPTYGLSNPAILNPIASPDSSTLYLITLTCVNGCIVTEEVFVEVVTPSELIIYGDTVMCEGSLGTLSANVGFISYVWSTGEEASNIIITTAGEYMLTAIDSNGCKSHASATVRYIEKPEIEISGPDSIYPGDTIRLSLEHPFPTYVWSTGSKEKCTDVSKPGLYMVSVVDTNGCIWSFEKNVTMAPRPLTTLILPDIVANPGDTVYLTVSIAAAQNMDGLSAIDYTGFMEYDKTVLYPMNILFEDIGQIRRIPIDGTYFIGEKSLICIPAIVTLGMVSESEISLEEFYWLPSFVEITANVGRIKINVCRDRGERLFDSSNILYLAQNYPNPFNATTRIGFSLVENGYTRLYVLDLMGRFVATLIDGFLAAGYHEQYCDGSELPTAQYYYILQTPTQTIVKMMTVLK